MIRIKSPLMVGKYTKLPKTKGILIGGTLRSHLAPSLNPVNKLATKPVRTEVFMRGRTYKETPS
jgi:hypothetical protein